MLLAAYCCEGHQIVAHAIAHGAVPVHATGFDTLLYFAVQELIRSLMPSPTKRFILRPHDDGVVLYCLSHGNQHCVVAAPREPERAFAAFALADLHARDAARSGSCSRVLGLLGGVGGDDASSSRCRTAAARARATARGSVGARRAAAEVELAVPWSRSAAAAVAAAARATCSTRRP